MKADRNKLVEDANALNKECTSILRTHADEKYETMPGETAAAVEKLRTLISKMAPMLGQMSSEQEVPAPGYDRLGCLVIYKQQISSHPVVGLPVEAKAYLMIMADSKGRVLRTVTMETPAIHTMPLPPVEGDIGKICEEMKIDPCGIVRHIRESMHLIAVNNMATQGTADA